MRRTCQGLAALALGLVLGCGGQAPPAAQTAGGQAAADRPAGVGPNGELDGLQAKFVDVNGVSTRYFDYGEGEPIVLIHGGVGVGMAG